MSQGVAPGRAHDGTREVPCPGCGTLCVFGPGNPWRPFCSERCKLGDFGAWAEEQYRVSAPPSSENDGEPG